MSSELSRRMDRRTAIKWLMAATAAIPIIDQITLGQTATVTKAVGYGPNPDVLKSYKPGELWPLTFTEAQRRPAAALCDAIIPAESDSPSASQVGVVEFLDEWISAPYDSPDFPYQKDRKTILEGLAWIDGEGEKRFGKKFADLDERQRHAICDDICYLPEAKLEFKDAATFFARYRDLTAGGFYTTPEGTKDLKYVGNVPMAAFDGPPLEVLKKVGLA